MYIDTCHVLMPQAPALRPSHKISTTSSSSPPLLMQLSLHPSALTSSCFTFFSRLPLATPAAGSAVKALARPSHYTQPLRTYASSKKKKMPPKKEVKQEKVLLGRPGNSLKSGIVCTCSARAIRDNTDARHRSVSLMSASRHFPGPDEMLSGQSRQFPLRNHRS